MGNLLDMISPISAGIGGLSSIYGLIQDSNARAAAQRAQQQALQQYGASADQQYQNMLGNGNRTLMGAAGQGGTALTNYGSNMGSALAGAGVYNSSATGGALAQAQANTNQELGQMGVQNAYNANSFHNQALGHIAQMQLGQANTDYGYANQDLNNSRAGLGQFLGALGTSNLLGAGGMGGQNSAYDSSYAKQQIGTVPEGDMYGGGTRQAGLNPGDGGLFGPSQMGALTQQNLSLGANSYRPALPSLNGTQNQGANLGGNAGGIGNGGQGSMGSSPFYQPMPGRGWGQVVQNPYGGPLGGR
jgi:hypothetical protein